MKHDFKTASINCFSKERLESKRVSSTNGYINYLFTRYLHRKRKPKERLKQIEELLDIKLEVDSNDQPSEQEA